MIPGCERYVENTNVVIANETDEGNRSIEGLVSDSSQLSEILDRLTKEGFKRSETIQQFHQTFPNARYRIFGLLVDDQFWSSEILLHGRYVLSLKIPIDIADSELAVHDSAAVFRITEVDKNHSINEEFPQFGFGNLNGRILSSSEWSQLVNNYGDFNEIGIYLKHDFPVSSFVKYYESVDFSGL